ncbi:MAG: SCO family protein [Gammaproteobacteria bacterium]|nr:SCO family protein [Gammaproteobacteria bacterium]
MVTNRELRGSKSFGCLATRLFILTILLSSMPLHSTAVEATLYDREQALATSQAAINRLVTNHSFIDENKNVVSIDDFRGKPLVVSLIFTSCHHICPTLTRNLAEIVDVAQVALGDDSFSLITVGFDSANDSPERMRLYARERGIDDSHWHFLSADEKTIKAFSDELGFLFFPTPRGFDHLSQVSILDSKGVVYRQIYGVSFKAPDLGEPLKELIFGNRQDVNLVEGWINNIKLFCTIYDPHSGRYEFDYSIFIGIFMGLLILGAIAIFILREWRHSNARST